MNKASNNWEQLRQRIAKNALSVDQNITLSSGSASSYFFDCKRVTLEGHSLTLIADEFLRLIDQLSPVPETIGGLTMGADAIAAGVAMRAAQLGHPTQTASIVRKEAKQHGTQKHIENEQDKGTQVVVIDDVITSGRSTKTACDKLIKAGYRISGIICLVDREEGGAKMLREHYQCSVKAVYRRSDFDLSPALLNALPANA